jgi:glutaredoxin 2
VSVKAELNERQNTIDSLTNTISDKQEVIANLICENDAIREELSTRDKLISDLQQKLRHAPEIEVPVKNQVCYL